MASKLKIDNSKMDSVSSSGTSTPSGGGGGGEGSSSAGGSSVNVSFKGAGQSLSGKKSKGKKERPIEAVDPFSMIRRTDRPKVVTNDTQVGDKKVPAALKLPFGQLYFGYDYIPPGGNAKEDPKQSTGQQRAVFSGAGQTLSGRAPRAKKSEGEENGARSAAASPAPAPPASDQPFGGSGRTLAASGNSGNGSGSGSGTSSRVSRKRERGGKTRDQPIVVDDSD